MSRQTLPDRRPCFTTHVTHEWATGREVRLLVTFGLDNSHKRIVELFCADFKAGTDLHSMIVDACVMMSLLMQHGYDARGVCAKLSGEPHSLLRSLAEAAVKVEETL